MDHPVLASLKRRDRSQNWLAKKTHLSKQYVSDIVCRTAPCSGWAAVLISRALDGDVSIEEIILANPKRARRRAKARAA